MPRRPSSAPPVPSSPPLHPTSFPTLRQLEINQKPKINFMDIVAQARKAKDSAPLEIKVACCCAVAHGTVHLMHVGGVNNRWEFW